MDSRSELKRLFDSGRFSGETRDMIGKAIERNDESYSAMILSTVVTNGDRARVYQRMEVLRASPFLEPAVRRVVERAMANENTLVAASESIGADEGAHMRRVVAVASAGGPKIPKELRERARRAVENHALLRDAYFEVVRRVAAEDIVANAGWFVYEPDRDVDELTGVFDRRKEAFFWVAHKVLAAFMKAATGTYKSPVGVVNYMENALMWSVERHAAMYAPESGTIVFNLGDVARYSQKTLYGVLTKNRMESTGIPYVLRFCEEGCEDLPNQLPRFPNPREIVRDLDTLYVNVDTPMDPENQDVDDLNSLQKLRTHPWNGTPVRCAHDRIGLMAPYTQQGERYPSAAIIFIHDEAAGVYKLWSVHMFYEAFSMAKLFARTVPHWIAKGLSEELRAEES